MRKHFLQSVCEVNASHVLWTEGANNHRCKNKLKISRNSGHPKLIAGYFLKEIYLLHVGKYRFVKSIFLISVRKILPRSLVEKKKKKTQKRRRFTFPCTNFVRFSFFFIHVFNPNNITTPRQLLHTNGPFWKRQCHQWALRSIMATVTLWRPLAKPSLALSSFCMLGVARN